MSMKSIGLDLWLLDVRVYRGKNQFRTREKFSGGRKDAETRYQEIRRNLQGKAKEDCSLKLSEKIETFGQALEWYYQARKENLVSPSSFRTMKNDLGEIPLSEIGTKFKQYWYILRRMRSRRTGACLSNSSINHYTVMAKAALNMCEKDGFIEKNPLRHIEILKVIPRDIYLSEIDRQRLLNVIDREAPHLSAIVRFAFLVPSRKSELVNLRREDLDLMNNAVRVRHENAKGDNGSWKPIPPGWLTEYFRNIPAEAEYLFFRHDWRGHCKPLGDFKRSWRRCLRLTGIPDFRFHDTRHISASDLLNAGNPEQVVCQIAGWKSGNMIKNYYHKDGLRAIKNIVFPDGKPYTSTVHLQSKVS
jgi:integrase